ncbi:hypothetical protein FIBSPDRAFT_850988 [Athelia psychrophila]|uniref:Uncharacterized protein n=1 Tax=Athelia psychrophila TaxID=1759441 RepID=A0A166SUE4_9AGAM|nr:hypothetical protein FIBSPDRAFT_850988 [Fibularhizoctonia sp. CBS 109695]
MHPEHIARDIAVLDVIGLSVHLAVAITDNDLYKEFYARRYGSAQPLLDLGPRTHSHDPLLRLLFRG